MSLPISTVVLHLIKKKDNYWEWRLTYENDTMVLSVGMKQGSVYVVQVHQK